MFRKFTPERRLAAFWAKVDKSGPVPPSRPDLGNCWLWTGAVSKAGYGVFWDGERSVYAHRYLREDAEGLEYDHLCRVRACLREDHVEAVPHLENVRRGAGHGKETHCPHGHPYDAENTYVRPDGSRFCRECGRVRNRRLYGPGLVHTPNGSTGQADS